MMKHRSHPQEGDDFSPSPSSETSPTPSISRGKTQERRRRNRFVHTRGLSMDSIPEEFAGNKVAKDSTKTATYLLLPLLIMLATTAMLVGSTEQWNDIQFHRSLLTLTTEHVNQYPFNNFLDVSDVLTQEKTMGFYWQVPRCGGTTLKHIIGTCLKRVQASRAAADYCDMNSDELSICHTKLGTFVNADPSDHLGIQRSEKMGLVTSGIADVVVSSRVLHAVTLFDAEHKGRLFTLLRDPIERAISTFYYLQNAYWERHYRPEYKEMTLLDYAAMPDTSNNWMTRWLTGKNAEPHLTRDDLAFAKELLRRKFLILLTEEMTVSTQRLMHYLGWELDEADMDDAQECLLAATDKKGGHNKNNHQLIEKDSAEYDALRQINNLDIELYEYAKELFVEQWSVLNRKGSPFDMDRVNSLFVPGNRTKAKRTKKKIPAKNFDALPLQFVEKLAETHLTKDLVKEASTSTALTAALLTLGEKVNGEQAANNKYAAPGDEAGSATDNINAQGDFSDRESVSRQENNADLVNWTTPRGMESNTGAAYGFDLPRDEESKTSTISSSQGSLPSFPFAHNLPKVEITNLSNEPHSDTSSLTVNQNQGSLASSAQLPTKHQHLPIAKEAWNATNPRSEATSTVPPPRSNGMETNSPRDLQTPLAGEFMNMLIIHEPASAAINQHRNVQWQQEHQDMREKGGPTGQAQDLSDEIREPHQQTDTTKTLHAGVENSQQQTDTLLTAQSQAPSAVTGKPQQQADAPTAEAHSHPAGFEKATEQV